LANPLQVYGVRSLIFPKRTLCRTELSGSVAPGIASVQVLFRRHGGPKQHRLDAVVAQVSGELQSRLKQPAPFGYFVAEMRGLPVKGSLRVRALDAQGDTVASRGA
jgi:hypothetical protein